MSNLNIVISISSFDKISTVIIDGNTCKVKPRYGDLSHYEDDDPELELEL